MVITTCTNRKRLPPQATLCARALPTGSTPEVAQSWFGRLSNYEGPRCAAADLYCGRSFREAETAAEGLGADLFVVSAGLGLIAATVQVPAYSLTLASPSPDNVLARTGEAASAWWAQVSARSPYGADDVDGGGLILAALPRPYLEMVAEAWADWPAERLMRTRLFCKEPPGALSVALGAAWMPYDDRLDRVDGDHAGTQADFAQRALRHFAEHVGREPGNAGDHGRQVREVLAAHEPPERPQRERLSDRAVVDLIAQEWEAVGGRSGAMLRRLRRDLNVACEQGRFKDLFKQAAAARQGALL